MPSGWHVDSVLIRWQKCSELLHVAFNKLQLKQRHYFTQKLAVMFACNASKTEFDSVNRCSQLEGKQARCEGEANQRSPQQPPSSFMFFYTKTFYSVGSQPTLFCLLAGGEPLRLFVGSVRQWNSCGAVVLSGGHTGWYWRLFSLLIYQLFFLQLIICPQMQRKPERWMSNICLKWFFDDQNCCWLIVCGLIHKLNDRCSSTDTGQSVSGKVMDEMQFDSCNLPPDNIQAWT